MFDAYHQPEMTARERAKWALAFIEDQIRWLFRGTLDRSYVICPYCATENPITAAEEKPWCCELMARASNAVIDRVEQEDRAQTAARALVKAAEEPPLVTLH